MRKVLIELNGGEFTVRCMEQVDATQVAQRGVFTVEAKDTVAAITITRLWFAGTPVEAIAKALELGLLPK